ncbi:hypothetical protein [Enteractinococcus fodinae]|uniref:O-antigen/teichoic acid export membrane protein n=1 Tax=Enteractinococcus fodinae TaxID=684663 RepID=A0ABU2B325_9MICC|nr:hypothetical protein [Enteractinococcus fodinae]MDR7347992.1 O-antigen/teichoic acid export membrane protein [Enteractinococcus fodinae]
MSISSIVAPAVALKFDTAALVGSTNRETRGIVTIALFSTLVISSAWAVISGLLSDVFIDGEPPAYMELWVFGITLLTGLFAVFSQLALRERRYIKVASRTVLQAVGTSSSQISFGVLSLGQVGLLAGYLIGRFVGLLALVPVVKKYLGKHTLREMSLSFRYYWRFPLVFAPSALINAAGSQLPLLTLTALYGLDFAGQLGMAERIISIPIGLVGASIGQMFMAEIARMRREQSFAYLRFFLRLSSFLLCVGILGFGALAIGAPWLVPIALGHDWNAAVPLIQILAVTSTIRLIAIPVARAISVFQRAKANVVIDIIRITLMAVAIYVVHEFPLSETGAVWLLYGTLAVVYVITWLYVLILLRAASKDTVRKSSTSLPT